MCLYTVLNNCKASKVYNKITLIVEGFVHIALDESNHFCPLQARDDEKANIDTLRSNHSPNNEAAPEKAEAKNDESLNYLSRDWKMLYDHPNVKF